MTKDCLPEPEKREYLLKLEKEGKTFYLYGFLRTANLDFAALQLSTETGSINNALHQNLISHIEHCHEVLAESSIDLANDQTHSHDFLVYLYAKGKKKLITEIFPPEEYTPEFCPNELVELWQKKDFSAIVKQLPTVSDEIAQAFFEQILAHLTNSDTLISVGLEFIHPLLERFKQAGYQISRVTENNQANSTPADPLNEVNSSPLQRFKQAGYQISHVIENNQANPTPADPLNEVNSSPLLSFSYRKSHRRPPLKTTNESTSSLCTSSFRKTPPR